MKKAFELQFHWMFIVIAGSLILGFFVKIALEQKNYSEKRIYIDYTKQLDNTFNTIIQNPNIPTNLSISKDIIDFSCDKSCNCKYKVGIGSENFNEKIIFAPKKVTQTLQLFSLDWNVPFRATNFLYITDTSKKYIILYDNSDVSQKLLNIVNISLPKSINHEFLDINDITTVTKKKIDYIFVFLNTQVLDIDNSFDDYEINGVLITKSNVEFLKKDPKQNFFSKIAGYQIISYDENSIIAAIISDNDLFKCGITKAFERLSYVAKVYEKRASSSEFRNFEPQICGGSYKNAENYFNQVSKQAKEIVASQLSKQIDRSLFDNIKNLNDNIERAGCSRII